MLYITCNKSHFIYYYTFRSIVERFNVGKATAVRTVRRVAKALCQLSPRYIAVCDHIMQFTHVYVGNVGSVHDVRIFRLSALQDYINDPNKFPNNTHLIGDAAYGLHQRLLVPYVDNGHLTERQKNYNYCHSSTRMVIERAFALLKGRWRSLLQLLAINRIDFTPYHILACCVLHTTC
ncbi:Putative nuclease HARBI1 [Trachymyrmex cornetzi]|uniref:Putative nuclease HARBI1 n=1 Tax=Trachymyrmex cornetzi TaxID=471704 RepID=A0A151J3A1_9HYME|nr:Putative nuclease HARBI1 [Trachymyrmex cornetzi]